MRALPAALILAPAALSLSADGNVERTLTILYSSSLNGNLDGCDCKGHPRTGLVKRAAWLRKLEHPEQVLLVDVGDLLDPYPDRDLATAIFDTYLELGYTAIALGDQEFANGLESLLEYRERYPLMAHNLTLCPDENRCIFFSTAPLIVERAGMSIGLFALIDPQVFTLYPPELKNKLKVQDPRTAARNQLAYLAEQGVQDCFLGGTIPTIRLYAGESMSTNAG
jgi:2',3'-cyclic-nucleotide 2'-phosphodiesterase (5'-nucleotidase family)